MNHSIAARIEEKIERVTESGCWIWMGVVQGKGYGRMNINNKSIAVHRAAWEEYNYPIPCGMFVLHRCDVMQCCNPEHLFIGTHADNMADMVDKGRGRNGKEKQTSCIRGHPLDGENLGISNGKRYCKQCDRDKYKARRQSMSHEQKNNRAEYLRDWWSKREETRAEYFRKWRAKRNQNDRYTNQPKQE